MNKSTPEQVSYLKISDSHKKDFIIISSHDHYRVKITSYINMKKNDSILCNFDMINSALSLFIGKDNGQLKMREKMEEKIIELIDERREILKEELKEIENQHCSSFSYAMGAFDELKSLKEEIEGLMDGSIKT